MAKLYLNIFFTDLPLRCIILKENIPNGQKWIKNRLFYFLRFGDINFWERFGDKDEF